MGLDRRRVIPLAWCISPNFGDALNPWLVEKISEKHVVFCNYGSGHEHYIVSGSILNWANDKSIVWGAGLASMGNEVCREAQIKAVRGPLSYMRAKACGAEVEPVWGDPALVLPRFIQRTQQPKYDIGIIPHYVDMMRVLAQYEGMDKVLVIDPFWPIEKYVQAVHACQRIISSSLHGIIVADAYRIPNCWAKFGDSILGDGMKFWDHEAAMQKIDSYQVPEFLDLRKEGPFPRDWLMKQTYKRVSEYRLQEQVGKLWNACPFRSDVK